MGDRFVGTYTPRVDDKGRVTLPAKYRDSFTPGVVVSRGQDHCLCVYTPDGFQRFAELTMAAPVTDPDARGFQRYLLANTDEQRPDAQGRISIPARMRDYAGLSKDAVVLGVGDRMEIWDLQRWETYEAAQEAAFAEPAQGLLGGAEKGGP